MQCPGKLPVTGSERPGGDREKRVGEAHWLRTALCGVEATVQSGPRLNQRRQFSSSARLRQDRQDTLAAHPLQKTSGICGRAVQLVHIARKQHQPAL